METNQSLRDKAWQYHRNNQLDNAEKIYVNLVKAEGNETDISNLGALLRRRGRINEAIELYRQWWGKCKITLSLSINAINAGIDARDMAITQTWLDQALERFPNEARLKIAKGKLLNLSGHKDLAIETLKNITNTHPQNIDAWLELGRIQSQNDQKKEALSSFKTANKIDNKDARAVANLITILEELGLSRENDDYINNTDEKVKQLNNVKGAIAYVYLLRNKAYEAEILYRELCENIPMEPVYWLNRCACKRQLKEGHAALRIVKQGIIYNPSNEDLRHAMSQCYAEIGNPKLSVIIMTPEISGSKQISENNLFNLQFIGEGYNVISTTILRKLAQEWEEKKIRAGISPIYSDRIEEEDKRKIRVAYLSADFCNHPVGRFVKPILTNHNRNEFEVIGIDCGSKDDDIKSEIIESCDRWKKVENMTDFEAARWISEQRIDILVELGGYTSKSKLGIVCYRPAKVQLSYLGYFGPTYLRTIDGWIGDDEIFGSLDPIQENAHKLIVMKTGYMTYEEKEPAKIKEIDRKVFCFGTFNHSRKLSDETIDIYSEVLKENKESRIIIKSISFTEQQEQRRIKQMLRQRGVEESRVVTLDYINDRTNHLDLYNQIDVALDPTPYGGATTTCEALIMGIPVVSLAGKGMVGRLSSSILKYSECDEWIAQDRKAYMIICKKLARKGVRNREDRLILREKVLRSKLCDNIGMTRELERVYKESMYIWEKADSR